MMLPVIGSTVELSDDVGILEGIDNEYGYVRAASSGDLVAVELMDLAEARPRKASFDRSAHAVSLWLQGQPIGVIAEAVENDHAALCRLDSFIAESTVDAPLQIGDAVCVKTGEQKVFGRVAAQGPDSTVWVDWNLDGGLSHGRIETDRLNLRYTHLKRAHREIVAVAHALLGQDQPIDPGQPADPFSNMERVQDYDVSLTQRPQSLKPEDLPLFVDMKEVADLTAMIVDEVLNAKIDQLVKKDEHDQRRSELEKVVKGLPEYAEAEKARLNESKANTRLDEAIQMLFESFETEDGLSDDVEVAAFRRVKSSALKLSAAVQRKYEEFYVLYYRTVQRTTPGTVKNKLRVAESLREFMKSKMPRMKDKIDQAFEEWKQVHGLADASTSQLKTYVGLFPKTEALENELRKRGIPSTEMGPDDYAERWLERSMPRSSALEREAQSVFTRVRETLRNFFNGFSEFVGAFRRAVTTTVDLVDTLEEVASEIDRIREEFENEVEEVMGELAGA